LCEWIIVVFSSMLLLEAVSIVENFQDKAKFIWQVADDILRDSFQQHEYGEVILPFVVLRCLDCVLEEPTIVIEHPVGESPFALHGLCDHP
jgi:hypothetical protein